MAFVCQNDRKIIQPPASNQRVGPGSYSPQNTHNQSIIGYAPFNSTTVRRAFDINKQLPGPGDYTIQQLIGQPSLTTYSNNSSIIIKVNSTGTNPFLSKQPRFQAGKQFNPGPGQYSLNVSERKTRKRSLPSRKLIVQPPRNQPSISAPKTMFLNQRRAKTEETLKHLKQELRKGFNSVGSVWARDKINRFKLKCDTEVGPDKYNLTRSLDSKDKKLTSGFASKTVKSFFDTIVFGTQSSQILEMRKHQGFKRQSPAPGFYFAEQQVKNQLQEYKNKSFGSTIKRFNSKQTNEKSKIPFYDVEMRKYKSSSKKCAPFGSEEKRCFTSESDSEIPGPGHYNPDMKQIGKILKQQFGQFGSSVKRQIYSTKQNEQIGPGYYQSNPIKLQQIKQSSVFRSIVPKMPQKQASDIKFGIYDTTNDDIGRKALQNRALRSNLKKINYQKPPFDLQQPRFRHYETQEPLQTNLRQRQLQYLSKKKQQKSKAISVLKDQIPSKISTISKSRRFDNPKNGPGVGDYSIRNKWVKKTFNVKYNNDAL